MGNKSMKVAALIATLLVLLGSFLLVPPETWQGTILDFHIVIALPAAMATVYLGAAILFLIGLKTYKTKLRVAYTTIAVGLVMNAIGTVQFALISVFDLLKTPWVQSGGVVLPFLLSGLCLYLGVSKFARLVGVTAFVTQARFILPAVLALSIVSAWVPSAPSILPELNRDIANGILCWVGLLDLAAAIVAWRLRHQLGSHYTKTITWLFLALLLCVLIVMISLVDDLAFGDSIAINVTANALSIIAGTLYLEAADTFHKTKDY